MVSELLAVLAKPLASVVSSFFPDPADKLKAQAMENELQKVLIDNAARVQVAAAEIVKAEAQGEGALQRNWRPIVMLTFTGLIVARWLGYAAPNITEAETLKLWDIVELGLGGYVIGRTGEKIMPSLINSLATIGRK